MSIVLILLLRILTMITFCKSVICIYSRHILYCPLLANYLCQLWLSKLHINLSRDIEFNPGPKSNSCKKLSVCHWNLNNISSHNISKVSLLNAYTSLHNFDIICLSETYVDSSILSHDPNLEVQGYDLIRANHPSNVKRGVVCIYYKNHLPLILTNINFLHECLTVELRIKNKQCLLVALYQSLSQSHNELSRFITNLESTLQAITLRKPFLTMVLGDVNAKSKLWFDQDNTSYKGSILNNLMGQYDLTQIIHEPTHILESSVSCIDLIITSQENLVTNSGVHSSLYPNCHHQIHFSNFNLKIHYPAQYECLIWKYEKANADLIKGPIKDFDWENKLSLIDISDQVVLFNETIVNTMSNFIPNETMTFDNRDPPWLKQNIKNMINYKNAIHNTHLS